MRLLSAILWLIGILVGVSFAVLNSHELPLNYFFGKTIIYFPFLFILLLLAGALLGMLALLPKLLRAKSKARQLKQKMQALEEEVTNLRRIPIKDAH